MENKIQSLRLGLDEIKTAKDLECFDSKLDDAIEDLELATELANLNYDILSKDIASYAMKQEIIKDVW